MNRLRVAFPTSQIKNMTVLIMAVNNCISVLMIFIVTLCAQSPSDNNSDVDGTVSNLSSHCDMRCSRSFVIIWCAGE